MPGDPATVEGISRYDCHAIADYRRIGGSLVRMGGDQFFKPQRRFLRNGRFHARSATATQSNSVADTGITRS